jgi:LysR family transcriptional regulator, nitrogen assimilation regulatory protein
MLEARHLSYFVAACQHLHLARAAAEINVAQSTLSMALKVLEENVGAPLFAPAKVGVLPTPEALWLYRVATAMLHAESFARSFAATETTEPADRVVVHSRLIFTIGRFAKAVSCVIEDLQKAFPATLFEPRWQAGEEALGAGFTGRSATVTIDYAENVADAGGGLPIVDDPWVLARELPTSTIREPSLDELMDGPIVVPALHPALLDQASDYIARAGLPRARLVRADPGTLPLLASEAPDTAFLVPRSVLSVRLGLLRVRMVPVGPGLVSRIVARIEGDAPGGEAFAKALREHLAGEERNVIFTPQLTLRQFRYFRTIHASRHLTAAARKANIAQPALSSQLLKMEAVTGTKLFERHRDGLVPTPAGDRLFQASGAVAAAVGRLEEGRSEAMGRAGGMIRIGMLPAVDHTSRMLATVASAISQWRRLHPAVAMQALEAPNGTLQEWLLAGSIGLAIVETDLPQLARFNLGPIEEMAVVANPRFGLVSGETVAFADLPRLPLVLPTSLFGIRQVVEASATELGVRIRPQIEVNSLPLTVALTRDNPLATILPPSAVAPDVARGDLACYRIEPALHRRLYAIYSNTRPLTQPERDLIRLLRDAMAAETGEARPA